MSILPQKQNNGDRDAQYEDYVRKFSRLVLRVSLRMLGHIEEAEEAHQETFTRFFIRFEDVVGTCNVGGWLYGTAKNICYETLKKRKRTLSLDPPIPGTEGLTFADMIEDERASAALNQVVSSHGPLQECLDWLGETSPGLLKVIMMYYREEMEGPEIAWSLGIPQGTVRSRHFHALRKLRKCLEQKEKENE